RDFHVTGVQTCALPIYQPAAGKGRHDFKGRPRHASEPKEEPSEKEIQDQIKATLARLSGAGKSGKFAQRAKLRRQKRDDIAHSEIGRASCRETGYGCRV